MRIITCDRCGKEIMPFDRHAVVNIHGALYEIADDYDLCKTCRKEVEDAFVLSEKRLRDWVRKKNGVEKLWPL